MAATLSTISCTCRNSYNYAVMTFLIGLIVLFCGAVISRECQCLPEPIRRFSAMVHSHRTMARIISFLIVLVVKCLADSTVVSCCSRAQELYVYIHILCCKWSEFSWFSFQLNGGGRGKRRIGRLWGNSNLIYRIHPTSPALYAVTTDTATMSSLLNTASGQHAL